MVSWDVFYQCVLQSKENGKCVALNVCSQKGPINAPLLWFYLGSLPLKIYSVCTKDGHWLCLLMSFTLTLQVRRHMRINVSDKSPSDSAARNLYSDCQRGHFFHLLYVHPICSSFFSQLTFCLTASEALLLLMCPAKNIPGSLTWLCITSFAA